MHYLYLIESVKYHIYYVGQTSDLKARLQEHNTNRSQYTKGKGPWRLVNYKTFGSRSEAMKEEIRLKKSKNRNYVYYYFTHEGQDIPT